VKRVVFVVKDTKAFSEVDPTKFMNRLLMTVGNHQILERGVPPSEESKPEEPPVEDKKKKKKKKKEEVEQPQQIVEQKREIHIFSATALPKKFTSIRSWKEA